MAESGRLRILIRTLPLEHGNYGGLLQAYALQQALLSIGADPVTDNATRFDRLTAKHRMKDAVRHTLLSLGYRKDGWLDRIAREADAPLIAQFAERRIASVPLYAAKDRIDSAVLAAADAFIAGSDQVWRTRYANPSDYLFDFLSDSDPRPRISYAASFGRDDLEGYGPGLLTRTAHLASRLGGISVRESSGVQLVSENWNLEATQHVDPTFLLPAKAYMDLASTAQDALPSDHVVDYVLDDDVDSRKTVAEVVKRNNAPHLSLIPATPQSYMRFRSAPERFRRPSVESWLGAIGAARMVVTDSFHGTALAIIHNVPFVSVVNRIRGAARFESLLSLFGLEDRLIEPGASVPEELVINPIDWRTVNARIAEERERSMLYLQQALGLSGNHRD